ncbi:unnamed protein product [Leptidea sinapis]|uniref:FLYWCH-type domain-containing protein n=1 Tax=Leptidea sinapis TaxID=189913 RepID=A0A5E4PZY9_9NEOP|nr:unnamed protein product [Leptidea sinapis]
MDVPCLKKKLELIRMVNGKVVVLYDGYTFYKKHVSRRAEQWYCTSSGNCRSRVTADKQGNIISVYMDHSHEKQVLVLSSTGYIIPFEYIGRGKRRMKKQEVDIIKSLRGQEILIRYGFRYNKHRLNKSGVTVWRCVNRIITMENGRNNLFMGGYTYNKYYESKKIIKWSCTARPACSAYVSTNHDLVIVEMNLDHNHKRRTLIQMESGRYMRI